MKKLSEKQREWAGTIAVFVGVLLIFFTLSNTVFLLTNIPSESMLDTLQVEDKVYGNRLAYIKDEPERGEIIIFHIEVPEDCFFMLGDNRNDSLDARYWENTFVER